MKTQLLVEHFILGIHVHHGNTIVHYRTWTWAGLWISCDPFSCGCCHLVKEKTPSR